MNGRHKGQSLLKEITWDLGRQDTGYIDKYTEVSPMCLPKRPILAHIDGKGGITVRYGTVDI